MLAMVEPLIVTVRGRRPQVDLEAWVAPNATLIGQAAGALIPQGAVIPPRSLVAGVPGRVRRELSDAGLAHNRENAAVCEQLVGLHRDPE